jgi:hypothetical protein
LANIAFARSLWPWAATAAASFEKLPFRFQLAYSRYRHDPKQLLVCCVRDKVLILRGVKSQGLSGRIKASMSDAW